MTEEDNEFGTVTYCRLIFSELSLIYDILSNKCAFNPFMFPFLLESIFSFSYFYSNEDELTLYILFIDNLGGD